MKMVLVGRASVPALMSAARDGRPTGKKHLKATVLHFHPSL